MWLFNRIAVQGFCGYNARLLVVSRTQIVLLGTGTPIADPLRSGPAVAILVDEVPYLVDCGPGIVRRAAAAVQMGVRALDSRNLRTLFLTHLHSDHTVGLSDLILTPWVMGREQPLEVFGPKGTRAMAEHILRAYDEDIQLRLHGLEHGHPDGWRVNVREFRAGVIYRDARVKVRAFRVRHGSWRHAFGFRFQTPDRVIVLSGDTVPHPNILKFARGCDVLIHEVYSHAGLMRRPPKWRRYHQHFHTSTVELAKIAKQTQPGLLVLYHHLFFGSTEEEMLSEIRVLYGGEVVSGKDLDVF